MDAPRLAGVDRRPDRLGSMFSVISWRYDFLNALMSLGQDGAWRRALARSIPRGARVLDLCCGSARSSVPAYERAGATITGLDMSFLMLQRGREYARDQGADFSPVNGDGFRLPFRDGTFDVVTAAFGLRNLVPLPDAAREIQRVLRPGGRFLALDSVAPAGGAFAPFHALYLRHGVPLLGRLSPDPAAYRYLSESIFDFGKPAAVAARLEATGFEAPVAVRLRMLGAVAIFEAVRSNALSRRAGAPGSMTQSENVAAQRNVEPSEKSALRVMAPDPVSRPHRSGRGGRMRQPAPGSTDRATLWVLLALHAALEASLIAAAWTLVKHMPTMPLGPLQKGMIEVGLGAAFLAFGLRALGLWRRLRPGPSSRGL